MYLYMAPSDHLTAHLDAWDFVFNSFGCSCMIYVMRHYEFCMHCNLASRIQNWIFFADQLKYLGD